MKNFKGSVWQHTPLTGTCLMSMGRPCPGDQPEWSWSWSLGGNWLNLAAYLTCEGTLEERAFSIITNKGSRNQYYPGGLPRIAPAA